MSEATPTVASSCSVCFHPRRKQIEEFIRGDANYAPILLWLTQQRAKDPKVRTYKTKMPLKRHREKCLGLAPLTSHGTPGANAVIGSASAEPVADVSDEEIYRRARGLLSERLSDLGAKELQALVVEGMKLERAKHAAKAKEKPDPEEEEQDDEAMAEVRRASTGLRAVS